MEPEAIPDSAKFLVFQLLSLEFPTYVKTHNQYWEINNGSYRRAKDFGWRLIEEIRASVIRRLTELASKVQGRMPSVELKWPLPQAQSCGATN
jgi:hypothetical protein